MIISSHLLLCKVLGQAAGAGLLIIMALLSTPLPLSPAPLHLLLAHLLDQVEHLLDPSAGEELLCLPHKALRLLLVALPHILHCQLEAFVRLVPVGLHHYQLYHLTMFEHIHGSGIGANLQARKVSLEIEYFTMVEPA